MNFVIALQAEAKPLIDALKMKKVSGSPPFPTFQNDRDQLVVSGIGKIASAGATGFLLGRNFTDDLASPFLNLGIAGHQSLDLESLFIADRILAEKDRQTFYPPQLIDPKIIRSSLLTCNQPSQKYEPDMGYDMEAHSFYITASKWITRELVQVVKIVSDNLQNPIHAVNPSSVTKGIEKNLASILSIVEELEALASEIRPSRKVTACKRQALLTQKFSQTQTHLLERLLNQAHSLKIQDAEILQCLEREKNAKNALKSIAALIEPHRVLP